MELFKSTDCIAIFGQRGCGKSYLNKMIQTAWPRKVVIDIMGEYQDDPDAIIVFDFNDLCDHLIKFKDQDTEKFKLVYQFDPEDDVSENTFNEIMRICYYFGNIQIVIEEVQEFCTPHEIPKWLRNCYLTGRHQNISVITTSQRPAYVNKTIVSLSDHKFCGRCSEANDLNYLSSFLGREKTSQLSQLPDRNFLHYSKDGIKLISTENSNF